MSAVNAITGYEYKGVNAATLGQGKWATFNQWRKAGYMVIKGQKGTKIMNRLVIDEDTKKVKFTGYSYVFNSEQVAPIEQPEEESQQPEEQQEKPEKEVNNTPPKKASKSSTPSKAAIRKVASQMSTGYRLMRVTYHGQTWTTDGYSAVNMELIATRKTCELQEHKDIDLAKLVDGHDEYEQGTIGPDLDDKHIMLLAKHGTLTVKVNAKWFDNLRNLYPNAIVKLTSPLTPVLFKEDGKLVAVLMPVKD